MTWTSIRDFLRIPKHLTGKGVGIAIIDSSFPYHPDIVTHSCRQTYIVNLESNNTIPALMLANEGPWNIGLHGLCTAAAAAGSGQLSQGHHAGAAPDANLYLLQTGAIRTVEETEMKYITALNWLSENWSIYHIRGVVLTITSTRDTGLLPWQADPIRVLCEKLASQGVLVIAASGNTRELTCNSPASSPSVLSVGGVIIPEDDDINHAKAYHGCRGLTFEGKWVPEVLAPAENVVLPMPFQSNEERQNHFTALHDNLPFAYARTEGTSYAAPIVLGCAACIWQAHPEWTADQVKDAIIGSTHRDTKWNELKAGLVNVANAVRMTPTDVAACNIYSKWLSLKNKAVFERLEAIKNQDEEVISSILLSFCGEKIPTEIMLQIKELFVHCSNKIRTAAILAIAFHPNQISSIELKELLLDTNHHVRMAALSALNRCPEFWHSLTFEIIHLFSDEHLDIRYCSFELAAKIKHECFINALISGLYDDATHERVSTFGSRCEALESITGITFEPLPQWREGQCWYSEESKQARLYITKKWMQWMKRRTENAACQKSINAK